jgi:MFS family permease
MTKKDDIITPRPYKNIYILGLISMFTDISSEMIYPLIPAFLVSIGANKTVVGLIEGIAESTASVFRIFFGRLSDRLGKRKIFVFFGYGLSAITKPLLYLAHIWPFVLIIRFVDRVGKAVRTPARDALISCSAKTTHKGTAFGIHRAMDTLGAIFGPLAAMFVLASFHNNVRFVFLFSFIPAIIAMVFIRLVREIKTGYRPTATVAHGYSIKNRPFIIFLVANIVFTLGNSSNAFLILKAREVGLSIVMIPLIWIVYNCSYAITAPIFGVWSDRIGRKPFIIVSFICYAVIYFLFGISKDLWIIWILFGAYGLYYGLSEGIFRAYIADLVEPERRATAYGLFNTGIGLALFPASLIMGMIWDSLGSRWAFLVSAGFSLLGFFIFVASLVSKKRNRRQGGHHEK